MKRDPARSVTATESFEHDEVVFVAYGCGQGDTLLVRFPGDRWILVDCRLLNETQQSAFFEFAEALGIKALQAIFLTHPDFDHYAGMHRVIQRFAKSDGSTYFVDSGLTPREVREYIKKRRNGVGSGLYSQLLRELRRGRVQWRTANEDAKRIEVGNVGYIEPIAPLRHVRLLNESAIGAASEDRSNAGGGNPYSLVVIARVHQTSVSATLLLAGDAQPRDLKKALEKWASANPDTAIDLIKIPHHGSFHSHYPPAYRHQHAAQRSFAVVSCGEGDGFPSRQVLGDALDAEWVVLATTTRIKKKRRRRQSADRLANLFLGRNQRKAASSMPATGMRHKSVCVRWKELGPDHQPSEARVRQPDLDLYA